MLLRFIFICVSVFRYVYMSEGAHGGQERHWISWSYEVVGSCEVVSCLNWWLGSELLSHFSSPQNSIPLFPARNYLHEEQWGMLRMSTEIVC